MAKPFLPVPKPDGGKPKGGKSPKAAGTRVERIAAKQTGGERTPGSGAFKQTNCNLTGDVEIPDVGGKPLVKLEVKMCGTLNTKGEKTFALTKDVLKQMLEEAEKAGEIGALYLKYKGDPQDDAWIIMPLKHWVEFLELAKLGKTMRK